METNNTHDVILNLKNEILKMENKASNLYFFTIDSKGAPNGYLSYLYETALQLHKMGYNVHMLHQDKEFVGVADWLGEEYMTIPHHNTEEEKLEVSASDILFIPEFYSNVMQQTAKMPCKRVVIAQNFNYMTQIIPVGASWANFGIKDCITTNNNLSMRLKNVFPFINIRVVNPVIDSNIFKAPTEPKKLIINIVAKEQTDVNNIVKPFFWKYPMYKWVAFRDLRGISKEDFAKNLQDAAFTVWVDTTTDFGYSAVEAMKCRSIVIGKVPETNVEWLYENGEFKNNGVWYFNNDDVHALIAGAIESFIKDGISPEIYNEMSKMDDLYTIEAFRENIEKVYINDIFENHLNTLKSNLEKLENNNE